MSMLRQSSNRNQRAQGFKLKHTLQVCVLVAICIWLLYQVKHSHDKKKALEESNSKIVSNVDESQPEIFRINRKDLPQISETDTTSETHNEEEENEEAEEAEQETKQEEVEDRGDRGDGSDEIDEQDQERADEEAERGEFADEEEKGGQAEELDIVEKGDSDMGSQEAREESFKGDDASSAVFEGNRKLEVESNEESRSSDEEKVENMEGKEVETEEDSGNLSEEKVENMEGKEAETEEDSGNLSEEKVETMERKEEETQNTDIVMNETVGTFEVNDSSVVDEVDGSNGLNVTLGEKETISSGNLTMGETGAETGELDDGTMSNLTLVDSHDQLDQQTNSTTATASNGQAELQSNTTTISAENQMEGQINMVTDGDLPQNVSVNLDSPLHNVSTSLESVQNQNDTAEIETSAEDASNSESVVTEQTEQSNTSSNLEESRHSITTSSAVNDNVDVAQGEAGDSSQNLVTEEEKETHTDLSILPADQNEVKSVEEVAAE